ncbi:acylphosphatase [Streptomyces sp. G45]|uniref:acylphosphatase n=1 Tax=Streptomyces sp. G45 TaxID=3406627 RepID=UPI003C25A5EE
MGFRPFVHRLAHQLGLTGWVANVGGHVEGEVAGPADAVAEFGRRLRADAPVLARVRDVEWTAPAPLLGARPRRDVPRPAQRPATASRRDPARDPARRGGPRPLPGGAVRPTGPALPVPVAEVDEAEARRTLDVLRSMTEAVAGELGEPLP